MTQETQSMLIDKVPLPPEDLIKGLKDRKAIAVVGSGLSREVGGPSWEYLLLGLVAEACMVHPRDSHAIYEAFEKIKKEQYPSAARILKGIFKGSFNTMVANEILNERNLKPRANIDFNRKKLIDQIFEKYNQPNPRNLSPSISHRLLVQLPFRAIITTNYDQLLENAVPKGKNFVYTRSNPYLFNRINDSSWCILKIHGCVSSPEDIIISRDDYSKILNDQPFREILQLLFRNNEVFWIGYGHNDQTLDLIIDECLIKTKKNSGFALVKKSDEMEIKNRFDDAHIIPLWVEDYSQFKDFLRNLAIRIDSPTVFEIITDYDLIDERCAENFGNRIALKLEYFINDSQNDSIRELFKDSGETLFFRANKNLDGVYLEVRASILIKYRKLIEDQNAEFIDLLNKFRIRLFDEIEIEKKMEIEKSILELMEKCRDRCIRNNTCFSTPHLFWAISKSNSRNEIKDIFRFCKSKKVFDKLEESIYAFMKSDREKYKNIQWFELEAIKKAKEAAIKDGAAVISARHILIGILQSKSTRNKSEENSIVRYLGSDLCKRIINYLQQESGTPLYRL